MNNNKENLSINIILQNRVVQFLLSDYFILPFIFFLGIAFRAIHLEYTSLDLDDVFSIYYANGSWEHLSKVFHADINPPAYYVALFGWFSIFEDTVFNARLLSVFFSAVSGSVIWIFSSKYFNKLTAIIALVLFLLSNYQLSVSHLVRGFAMSELFAILSFYFFNEIINHQKNSSKFLYILTTSILLNIHSTTFLIPLLQLIILFTFKWNKVNIRSILVSQLIISLSIIPQILFFSSVKDPLQQHWRKASNLNDVISTLEIISGSSILSYCYLIAMVFGIFIILTNKKVRESKWLLSVILWSALGFSLAYISSQKIPFFLPKYLSFLTIALYILMGRVLSFLISKNKWVLLVFPFLFYHTYNTLNFKITRGENWKKAVPIAKNFNMKGYDILVSPVYMYRPFTYYFDKEVFRHHDSILPVMYYEHHTYFSNTIDTNFFEYRLPKKLLFIQSQGSFIDPKQQNLKVLNQFFDHHKQFNIDGIELHLYEH